MHLLRLYLRFALCCFLLISSTVSAATHVKGCEPAILVLNADDDGAGSLRRAISELCAGGTISFAERFIIALQSEIVIGKALTIDGSSQSVDASTADDNLVQILGGASHRSFHVTTAGDLTLRRLRISNGTTGGTGGAISSDGRLAVHDCRFDGNTTGTGNGLGGGAIFARFQSTLLVEGSTFEANQAVRGAAIFNEGQAELRNSTFSGNVGITNEGAIQNRGTLLAVHITVANNGGPTAGSGGLFAFGAQTTLVNSIFADNVGQNCRIIGGAVTSTALLAESGSCSPQFTVDPQLEALAARGGVTTTLGLAASSPAINSGDPQFCLPTDQRGIARPQGAGCDLGAFEVSDQIFGDGFEDVQVGVVVQ